MCVQVVKAHHNICKVLHMPAQSGSTRVLQAMRRGYSREAYLALVDRIRAVIPQASPETLLVRRFFSHAPIGAIPRPHALDR